MLGNGRLEALCFDGEKRLAHIRGKLRKKVWINQGDIILLSLRDYQDEKGDVILKYSADEARSLKAYGELPESAKINETDTYVPSLSLLRGSNANSFQLRPRGCRRQHRVRRGPRRQQRRREGGRHRRHLSVLIPFPTPRLSSLFSPPNNPSLDTFQNPQTTTPVTNLMHATSSAPSHKLEFCQIPQSKQPQPSIRTLETGLLCQVTSSSSTPTSRPQNPRPHGRQAAFPTQASIDKF